MVPASHPLSGRGFGNLAVAAQMGREADCVLLLGARLGLFTPRRAAHPARRAADPGRHRRRGDRPQPQGRSRRRRRLPRDAARAAGFRLGARGRSGRPGSPGSTAPARPIGAMPTPWRARRVRSIRTGWPPRSRAPARRHHRRRRRRDRHLDGDGGQVEGGGRWMSHGYLGCLGTGLPFAIAAKVAHPDRAVLCVIGDGSVGLNFAEFDTMARHGLPIVTVINNDQLWGMSAHGQDLIYGPGAGSRPSSRPPLRPSRGRIRVPCGVRHRARRPRPRSSARSPAAGRPAST